MVMAKPIQFTKVKPVPFNSLGIAAATKFENWGESAVTAIPQKHQTPKNNVVDDKKSIGDNKQHVPEIDKATKATFLLPYFWESTPPIPQEIPPKAIIIPVHKGTEIVLPENELKVLIANGVKAQKAYSSHM